MNAAAARFRPMRFGIESAVLEHLDGGQIDLHSEPALQPYPHRLSDRLLRWAQETPEHTYLAKRGPDGQWQRLSYAQALQSARAIGQALLDRHVFADVHGKAGLAH